MQVSSLIGCAMENKGFQGDGGGDENDDVYQDYSGLNGKEEDTQPEG